MKKTISLLIIISLIFCGITLLPAQVSAYDEGANAIHNIFIDTLYGMAIGVALGVAFSADKGKDGSDLTENIGAGAAIGGLLGAGYGIFLEYKGMAEIQNNKICFHVPTFNLSSNSTSGEMTVHTNLVRFRF